MVAQDADRSETTMGHMPQDAAQLLELARTPIGDPVAGDDYEVGCEFLHPAERLDDVVIVHFGADMQIANLCEGPSLEFAGKTRDGQYGVSEFQPMRLDAPSVKPQRERARSCDCQRPERLAASKHSCHRWS